MSDFDFAPLKGLSCKSAPRNRVSQFGDGYSQRTKDGINTNPGEWNLSFRFEDENKTGRIESFLKEKAGVMAFTWTPPGSPEGKFICSGRNRTYEFKGRSTITAVFLEVFE